MRNCRLYLISPDGFELESFKGQLNKAFEGGDVASFQLRLKAASNDEIIKISKELIPLCHKYDVAFILNDDPKLALEVGADGVHIGQSDGSLDEARTILGHNSIIGLTCNDSKHLAFEAGEAGADYIAFGAFFPSQTKETNKQPPVSIITDWVKFVEIPCVSIGGITVDNCKSLIDAGSDFLAVGAGAWEYPKGPKEAVEKFNKILKEA